MSPPSAPPPSTDALVAALSALPPRSARLLVLRLVEGRPLLVCAELYGVSTGALAVHLLRAGRDLAAALVTPGGAARHPVRGAAAEEEAEARWLARALETDARGLPPTGTGADLPALAALLAHVRRCAAPLREGLAAAEEAQARSPERRREENLRRLAVLALLALTAYFLLR